MSFKEIMAVLSILFSSICSIVYIIAVIKRETKPHVFSWVIWSVLMLTSAVIQYAGHAGWGAYAIGFGGLTCIVISCLTLFYGETAIVRSDWVAFLSGLMAFPLWYVTKDPLYAALLVTAIDLLGYYPSFRKAYGKPFEENPVAFAFGFLSSLTATLAVEEYSLTSASYPAAITVTNAVFVAMILWRRRVITE